MRLLRWVMPALVSLALVACGPPRKSVFPPTVSIQQLELRDDGAWALTVRIQNNSYTGMDFRAIDGQLALGDGVPVRLHARFDLGIPAFAGDTVAVRVLPTAAMAQALAASATRGSAGALPYTLDGTVQATVEQDDHVLDLDFSGKDWLSPVPGIAHTWR